MIAYYRNGELAEVYRLGPSHCGVRYCKGIRSSWRAPVAGGNVTAPRQAQRARTSRLLRIVAQLADEGNSRPTTIDVTGPRSTRDLLSLADAIAEGLRPGERLAVVADGHALVLASLLAASQVRGSVALVSPYQREVDAMIARFDPSAVVALPSQPGPTRDCEGTGGTVGRRTVHFARGEPGDFVLTAFRPRRPFDAEAAPLIVLFTSGTAGRPKMVAHTESSVLAAYRLVRSVWFEMLAPELLSSVDDGRSDGSGLGPWFGEKASLGVAMTYLSGMPAASVAGLSLAMQALLSGGCIVDRPRYSPDAILGAVSDLRVTSLGVAPITAQMLVRAAVHRHTDASPLIVVGMGGSGVTPGLHRSIEEVFGCRVVSGYGATELGGVVATTRYTDPDEDRWTCLGSPVPGVRCRVDDGELLVRSPSLAAGYLLEDGQVAPLTGPSGWYRTGDLVSTLDRGRYSFEGRRSEVIVRGGRKIHPEIVEAVLLSHCSVQHAAVVGAPSRVAGEEDVVAYVTVTAAVGASELRRWCGDRLGPGTSPRRVQVLDELPLDAFGRPDRQQLRWRATTEVLGSAGGTRTQRRGR